MKRTLARFAFLFATLLALRPADAYYAPLLTTEMIGLADLIVFGSIQHVTADDFVFRVERQLYGRKAEPGPLVVRRFRDWPCASRWAPHKADQRLILLLGAGSGTDQRWRILGAGDEGEMLVEGDVVYHQLWPDRRQRSQTYAVRGGRFYGVQAPLADVLAALAEYRSLWRLVTDDRGWGRAVLLVGTQEAATAYSRRSLFHRSLALQSANFDEAARYR